MTELQFILILIDELRARLAQRRDFPDQGEVAEKVVLIGIFVVLVLAIGVIITKAVTANANHIANQINP